MDSKFVLIFKILTNLDTEVLFRILINYQFTVL